MACLGDNEGFAKTSKEKLSIEWRIPSFFSLSDGNGVVHSPQFDFCGAEWSLYLWKQHTEEEESPCFEWIALHLMRNHDFSNINEISKNPPETIHFRLGVRGPQGVEMATEDVRKFSEMYDVYYGWRKFLSRSDLKSHESRLVPGDVLTIVIEMKRDAHGSGKGVEKLQKSLRSMLMSGEDSDIIIKVQGVEFSCHKAILRSRSPIFGVMFSNDMADNRSNVVTVDDCDPQTFSDFLDHVYTGSSEKISAGNVLNLYMISDKYKMDTLKQQCVVFLERNLCVASFCSVMKLAVKHDDKALIEISTQFFCKNSSDIVTTTEWHAFYEKNSTVGYQLFIKALTK